MSAEYEIRIAGPVGEDGRRALRDLDMRVVDENGGVTVVHGRLDQPGLHGLLDRLRALGLPLEEVRRLPRGSRPS
ncbi:MAG TPA: hypothetical protein VES95_13445 [Dermatophilaceae bacterium]|nr:hypothetical protein [Dermatophilaceae bacterium]